MVSASFSVLERERELGVLGAAVAGAARGEGAVVVVEGVAGIGKSALLRAGAEEVRELGFTVLRAAGSELDRSFPFGVVHQLFDGLLAGAEPERRGRLLAGAAGLAEAVLGPGAVSEPVDDPSHTVLHGLYWLCANLAQDEPVALLIDDLHWADCPSLRFLEFLGRRLEGLAVVVLGALRAGEAGDNDVLGVLLGGPAVSVVRPDPLSVEAVGALAQSALGGEPEAAFVERCSAATGGNPLLLRELLRAAVDGGLDGRAEEAERLGELAAVGMAGVVARRLRALGAGTVALARAVAVIGPRARVGDLAALAGLDEAQASAAVDALVGAGILAAGNRGFLHPLVGEAVSAATGPSERARLHAAAARRLADEGAPAPRVAVHLLRAEPAGACWAVDTLRAAARVAMAEGAVDTAAAQLERAWDEPPPPASRAEVLVELGEAELRAGRPQAIDRLGGAVAQAPPGDLQARARLAHGQALMQAMRAPEALGELESALVQAEDPALRARVEAALLDSAGMDRRLRRDYRRLLSAPGPPSLARLAHLAFAAATSGRPASAVVSLARRALERSESLPNARKGSLSYGYLIGALVFAEEAGLTNELVSAWEAEARRTGSKTSAIYTAQIRGRWARMFGSLAVAEASMRTALDLSQEASFELAMPTMIATRLDLLLERHSLEEAATLVERLPPVDLWKDLFMASQILAARGRVRWAQGRHDEAMSDLRAAVELHRQWDYGAVLFDRALPALATLLAARGEHDEARALAQEGERAARAAQTPGAVGVMLRARAAAAEGQQREALLHEAETTLRSSALGLDHAWALHDLGAHLRRSGRRSVARASLHEAWDTATRLGADRLARTARDELLASGARPRSDAPSGVGALTPSERRVADLAAQGLSNREIAESLWVTRKTVEVHLGHAYGKLGIRSRIQLTDALKE